MIFRTKRSGCAQRIASTRSRRSGRLLLLALPLGAALLLACVARAEPPDPEVARMLERALANAETFRKQLKSSEYDAKMRVQEWDARGRLRGTALAQAIIRPGDARPMIFVSREVQGKVRLPDDKPDKSDEDEKEVTLQEFAREHQIAERFEFTVTGSEEIAGERARRVSFRPKPKQPVKNTADRFLNTISGTAWVSEGENKLVKFDLKLMHPFQLFWIFAVLKDLSIEYELITPGEILGHAKIKVLYALTTPVYSIKQLHDVDIANFRRRNAVAAARN
jgi:hypothetical protein